MSPVARTISPPPVRALVRSEARLSRPVGAVAAGRPSSEFRPVSSAQTSPRFGRSGSMVAPEVTDCRPGPLADLLEKLSVSTRRAVLDAIDLLRRLHADVADLPSTLESIADRMLLLGLPLDRMTVLTQAEPPEAEAFECDWVRNHDGADDGGTGPGFDPSRRSDRRTDLRALAFRDDCAFATVSREGTRQLLRMALPLARSAKGSLLLMTGAPSGFTATHRDIVEALVPSIGNLLAARADRLASGRLLRTYLGAATHDAILSGIAERGQAIPIRSAILFADMRDSLGHTADIDSFQQVDLLNRFFDCLVPPIEARGGEVLKFTGDGLLAIFPEQDDKDPVARHALDAAREALDNLDAMNAARLTRRPIELGIGLHYGEAAFGNVGSGLRLDFTVVGRSIGLASRIGGLNKVLSEPVLMSSSFAQRLGEGAEPVGDFAVAGIRSPISILRPL